MRRGYRCSRATRHPVPITGSGCGPAGPPGRRIVLFDYDPSRGGAVPMRLFEGFKGILLTDGYEPYNAVASAYQLVHAGCWAHARRYFDEARKAHPDAASISRSRIAIDFIGKLYRVEREAKESTAGAAAGHAHAVLHQDPRRAQGLARGQRQGGPAAKRTGQGRSLRPQSVAQADPLSRRRRRSRWTTTAARTRFDPSWSAARPGSLPIPRPGATASANLYSLIETAKANGVEPHAYLARLFAELPHAQRRAVRSAAAVECETPLTAGLLRARDIPLFAAVIGAATWSYLFLLAWAIAYAALSRAPPWWRTLIPSIKGANLSWLWLSHALAVVLVTIPIALGIRFCLARRRLVAAFSVSVLAFLLLALPAMALSFAKQPLYTIWEQMLLIGALPGMVWIIDTSVRRLDQRRP